MISLDNEQKKKKYNIDHYRFFDKYWIKDNLNLNESKLINIYYIF